MKQITYVSLLRLPPNDPGDVMIADQLLMQKVNELVDAVNELRAKPRTRKPATHTASAQRTNEAIKQRKSLAEDK
jgi:hypothetical protein